MLFRSHCLTPCTNSRGRHRGTCCAVVVSQSWLDPPEHIPPMQKKTGSRLARNVISSLLLFGSSTAGSSNLREVLSSPGPSKADSARAMWCDATCARGVNPADRWSHLATFPIYREDLDQPSRKSPFPEDTWSTRCAAVCDLRRAPHEGQNPRRLQLNATSLSWPQSPHQPRFHGLTFR